MASKIKTIKGLEKLVNTWLRNDPDKGQEITMILKENGLLTKGGKISKSKKIYKRKKSEASAFEKALKTIEGKYGYYSDYVKEIKEKFKKAKEERYTNAKNWKEFEKQRSTLNNLIDKLFENFPSDVSYEEFEYISTLDMNAAIERLSSEIESGHIFVAEEYRKEYGDFTAPEF